MSEKKKKLYVVRPITVVSQEEAEKTLNYLESVIKQDGRVTVGTFYRNIGLTETYKDEKWGWTDLDDAGIEKSSEGYILTLPDPVELSSKKMPAYPNFEELKAQMNSDLASDFEQWVSNQGDPSRSRLERVKRHILRNKNLYVVGAAALVVGVVGGAAIVRTAGNISVTGDVAGDVLAVTGKNHTVSKVVIELVERSTASKPVHLVGTNLYFNSLSEASRQTGHALSKMSRHINGHIPDINGDVFELLTLAE